MKKTILTLALICFASFGFAQKGTVVKDKVTPPTEQLFLVLTPTELNSLFSIIRTSGKFKGSEIEDMIAYLQSKVVTIPGFGTGLGTKQVDSTAKKK